MTRDPAAEGEEDRDRRRLLLLLAAAAVVLVGAGIGWVQLPGPPDRGPPTVEVTPGPATPTPSPTPEPTDATPREESPTGLRTESPPGTTVPPSPTPTPSATRTPTDTATPAGDGEANGDGDRNRDRRRDRGGSAGASLSVEGSSTFVRLSATEPGSTGRERVRVRNAGDAAARLVVADVTVEDRENGVVGPEAAVDNSPSEGELSEHLRIALATDGGATDVVGTASNPIPLAAVAASGEYAGPVLGPGERTTLRLTWTLPPETGNVVQSDGVAFDVRFRLQTAE